MVLAEAFPCADHPGGGAGRRRGEEARTSEHKQPIGASAPTAGTIDRGRRRSVEPYDRVAELVTHLAFAANLAAAAEGLALAAKAELDPNRFLEVALASSGASAALERHGPLMLRHDFAPADGTLADLRRDLEAALDLARQVGAPAPLGALVHGWVLSAVRCGHSSDGPAALATVYEALAGVRLDAVAARAAPGLRPPAANDETPRVGFIGLGKMGRPIAECLMRAGLALVVHNRSQAVVEALVRQGAERAATPAEVAARADVVLTCLPDDAAVERVYTGPDGLLAAARSDLVLLDLGTTGLALTRRLAEDATARGTHFVDGPVSGGISAAVQGTLTIMLGASEEAFRRASPVLAAIGRRLFHLGPPGSGQVTKQINNMLLYIHGAGGLEALAVGMAAGAPLAHLVAALERSRGASYALATRSKLLVERDFQPRFSHYGRLKDGRAVLDLGAALHVPLVLAAISQELHQVAVASGWGDEDWASLIKVYERLAGIGA